MPRTPARTRTREQRIFLVNGLELRDDTDRGTVHLTGYASVFDTPYEVNDLFGSFTETIRSGAFARTIQQADIRLLVNHDGIPLARTKSGTLRLSEDNVGLHIDADLDAGSGAVQDVRSALARGDLDQMSFAFDRESVKDTWSSDYSQRDITEVRLYDVSIVTFPANDAATVALRSEALTRFADDLNSDRLQQFFAAATDLRDGKSLSSDNAALVVTAASAIQSLLDQIDDADMPSDADAGEDNSDNEDDTNEQGNATDAFGNDDGAGARSLRRSQAEALALKVFCLNKA